ncbi:MAG: dethiobiotin synthase [Caulobacterales bacterium]
MKHVIFVAGTGTDIGKTYVAASMIREAVAAGRKTVVLKPVVSAVPEPDDPAFAQSDMAVLLTAQGLPVDEEHVQAISPWRFKAALSPDMAARLEGRSVHFDALLDWARMRIRGAPADAFVLIEGAGGLMSPLSVKNTNLDLLAALGARALLVAGNYLGAISHTLTAVEALKARNVDLAGIVVNECEGDHPPLESIVETLTRFLPETCVTKVARYKKPEGLLSLL